jgi:hypothetical protein
MNCTMQNRTNSTGLAQRVKSVAAATRALQQRLKRALKRLSRNPYERILAESVDRFALERRERALNRGQ